MEGKRGAWRTAGGIVLLGAALMAAMAGCGEANRGIGQPAAAGPSPVHGAETGAQHRTPKPASEEIALQRETANADGDGKLEEIRLYYDGELRLSVDGRDVQVSGEMPKEKEAFEDGVHTAFFRKPAIDLIPDGKRLALLVSLEWSTNKYGSTAELWAYSFHAGELAQTWSVQAPDVAATLAQRRVHLEVPELDYRQTMEWKSETERRMKAEEPGRQPGKQQVLRTMNRQFWLKDIDGDGQEELVTERLVFWPDHVVDYDFFAVYHVTSRGVVPQKAFFIPSSDIDLVFRLLDFGDIRLDGQDAARDDNEERKLSAIQAQLERLAAQHIVRRQDDGRWVLMLK